MLDPSLRATLEQRLGDVQFAATLEASPTRTIKPSAAPPSGAASLPIISLLVGGEPAPSPLAGRPPDLEVRALLGEGGMGKVELAFQRSLGREVAIKSPRAGTSVSAAAALVREAIITGSLEHPGVVPVHALGLDTTGAPVLVMKRIEGVEWGALMDAPDHPGWNTRPGDRLATHLEVFTKVCQTVQFAHARGVLHLDIKPENVMVGDFGEVLLVDWGIARRFDPASATPTPHPGLAGTPAYMAPEMVAGGGVDPRTDVFLLGATLHTALTGQVRNAGTEVAEVLVSALSVEPYEYGPSVPAELAEICNRATARDRSARFASADALRLAVVEHLRHRGSIALAEQASERSAGLAELIASAPEGKPPDDLRRAYQLASEARFGFEQALREWPGNRLARDRRCESLARVVELELRQGHVDAAEAALLEIDPVPAALRERFDRARAAREREQAEHARLRALAKDLDPSVASKQRAIALGLFSIMATAAAVSVVTHRTVFGPWTLLYISGGFLAAAALVTLAMRRKLLENSFNRQASMLFVTGAAGLVLSRGVALVEHIGIDATAMFDMLVLWLLSVAGAITLVRGLWILVGVLSASLALGLAMPGRADIVFAADTVLLPIAIAYALHLHGRSAT
jgi:eukaryotic-like serine/threonine-protein kinase